MKLSSLAFKDLLIMANADEPSVKTIKDTLEAFESMSGLRPNMQKFEVSNFYTQTVYNL